MYIQQLTHSVTNIHLQSNITIHSCPRKKRPPLGDVDKPFLVLASMMEVLEASNMGMSVVFSQFLNSMLNPDHTNSIFNPIFLHGFSASIYLVFFSFLFLSFLCKKSNINPNNEGPKRSLRDTGFLYYKHTLFSCLGLSLFNLDLCFLNLFYWYRNGWPDEKIVTFSNTVLGTLVWLAVSVYLHTQFSNLGKPKYPIVLRVWWAFFFSLSCYCLVIDCVNYKQHHNVPIQFWLSDVVSTFMGLFFCCFGFSNKNKGVAENILLEETLLNGSSSSVRNGRESNRGETNTRYANSSVFSLLNFSWMDPLIAIGYKKPLDLEDVPQLTTVDSANGAFLILRNKLESDKGRSNQIISFGLAKAVIFVTWKDILVTALLALLYTCASYVGPYVIDTFVQYLNGCRDFRNKGYLLVFVFFFAKLVECLAQRHWSFKLQ